MWLLALFMYVYVVFIWVKFSVYSHTISNCWLVSSHTLCSMIIATIQNGGFTSPFCVESGGNIQGMPAMMERRKRMIIVYIYIYPYPYWGMVINPLMGSI